MLKLKKDRLESLEREQETAESSFDRLPDEVSSSFAEFLYLESNSIFYERHAVVDTDLLLPESQKSPYVSWCLSSLALFSGQFHSIPKR